MLKQFKFPAGGKYIFVSDLHFNQGKDYLFEKRGFSSQEEHDNWVLSELTLGSDEETIIFNLGDQAFRDPQSDHFNKLQNIQCKEHYLLFGNHNSGCKQVFKSVNGHETETYPTKVGRLTFIGNYLEIFIGSQPIVLSHTPFLIWVGMQIGAWNCTAHSHGSCAFTRYDNTDYGKCLDVGIEEALRYTSESGAYEGYQNPYFTYEDIEQIMKNKPVVARDHHTGESEGQRVF